MRKFVLTFGLIAGGMLAVLLILTQVVIGEEFLDHGAIIGYTGMVAAFLMVYFGVRAYRDHLGGKPLSFGRAFAAGILITVVASACYVATWEVIVYKFTPDFADKYAAHELRKAREAHATDAEIAKIEKDMQMFKQLYANPLVNIALTFLEPLPVGLVFAIVTAVVMSRKRKDELAVA
ncbi:MAG TPA: DUF4199 domain-containing protein [Gemmatimonadales bacterium]|jgi:amino acid transporter